MILSQGKASADWLDLTTDNLRQLELRNKRQSMKISLFGGIVEDYMKCSKATKPEESRLASDEAENIPYIFSVPEPIKLPAKQRDRGSIKIGLPFVHLAFRRIQKQ